MSAAANCMGPQAGNPIQLSDFVGDHGPYQLYITVLLFIRYVFLGLMSNSGPMMTPDVTFYCQLPMEEIAAIMPNITLLNKTEQELEIKEEFKRICQLDLHLYQQAYLNSSPVLPVNAPARIKFNATDKTRQCLDFTYEIAPDQGRTMTSEFDLVCDRDWLRSMFQSLISASIVLAHVFWGTFSDRYGRFRAQKLCLLLSLLAGILSVFAMEFWTFVVARALCSFGDLGVVVSLTTTVVELVGNQYRGLSVAIVNFGSALGVTIFPYIVAYFEDFRKVVAFTVLCHIATMPFLWTNNESVRWLLTNRKFNPAKRELRRICRWNRKSKSVKRRLFRLFGAVCGSPMALAGSAAAGAVPPAGQQQQQQPTTEVAAPRPDSGISVSANEKKAFEELYNRFIDQIESQNFCDPMGATSCSEIDSPQPSDATDASMDCCPLPNLLATKTSGAISIETGGEQPNEAAFIQVEEPPERSASVCKLDAYQEICVKRPAQVTAIEMIKQNSAVYEDRQRQRAESCCQFDELGIAGQGRPKLADSDRERHKSLWLPRTMAAELPSRAARSATIAAVGLRRRSEVHTIRRQPAQQPDCINLVASQLSFMGRVNRLFKDKQLMIAVFTIVWTTFNSELQYTSFIIINLEVGEDVYLNYILGGCMEAVAAIVASLLLSYAPRRHSLIIFWLLISLSCFGLSVAHIDSTWAVWLLALAKFSQSCLSSVASVAAYESFPTFLRQSGSGLVFTLGMLGSVFAPLIFAEFDDQAGMDRVLMTFSFSSLTAAILIYLYLKETSNCELQ